MAHTTGEGAHLLSGVHARRTAEQRLRDEITRGAVVPGQRLVEPELGERYGVTRNSARPAVDALIADGLVERIPDRGARVRVVSTREAVDRAPPVPVVAAPGVGPAVARRADAGRRRHHGAPGRLRRSAARAHLQEVIDALVLESAEG